MVFWKYFDSVYNLFSTLSSLYVEGQERMRRGGVETGTSVQGPDMGPTEQDIADFEEELDDGFARVMFKGHIYEVDLDKVKEIPPNHNPETYIQNNKKEYLEHAFKRYKEFIEKDKDYVGLFLYGDRVFGADKDIVKQGLSECLNYFIDTEDYETASEVRDLLEKIEHNYE